MGALGTLVQYLILYLCVEYLHYSPVWGSSIGFVVGAIVNYHCNYYITFKSRHSHYLAAGKFIVVASIGLFLNGMVMHLGIYFGMKYFYAQVMATFLVLFWNFFVNRHWTFTSKKQKG
jgi:putative flippase GtrA